ncbi:sensor histidine kinase [Arsenicicoccus sp. oral taxon 190]|uniref:sensor histidine kinase n=1 Tax=Arsenicicoccus sp. oral taxon 190 TaxID=1658671 RepID=UPI001C11E6C8|nr:sensor histidine kinase [Arsenicicoccus sp. oral taxon 190]
MTETGGAHPVLSNPWQHYGWMTAAIWLVFLVYPVLSVLGSGKPLLAKAVTVGIVLGFAVIYVAAMNRCWIFGRSQRLDRTALAWFGVLVALTLATVPVIGLDALGLTPYLTSFAVFTFPWRGVWAVVAAAVASVLGAPLALGRLSEWGSFLIILVIVLVSTTLTRVATSKDIEYTAAKDALRIAQERERVARDVHDVLGHSLTVVSVKAELAERLLDVDVDRARAELTEIRALTRTALAEIRETVGGLRIASLADEIDGARMALAGAGIDAELPEDLGVVDPRHRTVVAWVLREAVTNVVRHSGARRCVVRLSAAGLDVQDDGRGLRGRKEGNGIRGLRERLAGAGGTLVLGAGLDGRGTRLQAVLDADGVPPGGGPEREGASAWSGASGAGTSGAGAAGAGAAGAGAAGAGTSGGASAKAGASGAGAAGASGGDGRDVAGRGRAAYGRAHPVPDPLRTARGEGGRWG